MAMTTSLESLRKKIDKLDDEIHKLLMQRGELIQDITEAKKGLNKPIVHPAREAMMIRRLLGNHKGILPQATIINIWRELVGAVSMMQRGLTGFVSTRKDHAECWDMAKSYCGNVIPMSKCSEPSAALASVRDTPDSIAVLPWPNDQDAHPWWGHLIDQERPKALLPIQIVAALPFGSPHAYNTLEKRALVIGRMEYNPSGDDHSFIGLTANAPLSRAKIIELLKEQGLETAFITSQPDQHAAHHYYIAEVKAYLTEEDKAFAAFNAKLSELEETTPAKILGGYPVPPTLRSNDISPLSHSEKA